MSKGEERMDEGRRKEAMRWMRVEKGGNVDKRRKVSEGK